MSRYFIFIQYNGSRYHGWQVQPNALTVQEILDQKLGILLGEKMDTTGAGRTDTGVHAREFAAHFDTETPLELNKDHFIYKMNCLLPKDISVYDLKRVKDQAHARFDAISRTYEYHLVSTKDPFSIEYGWFYPWTLDLDKMNRACEILFHYIDFTSFSKLHTDVKTNDCRISFAQWEQKESRIIFTITADRFLRNMVRAIVGTLVDIGRGKTSLEEFIQLIQKKNRNSAGVSAPAQGLYLTKILFPSEIFI